MYSAGEGRYLTQLLHLDTPGKNATKCIISVSLQFILTIYKPKIRRQRITIFDFDVFQCLFSLPALININARKNFIADVDVELLLNRSSNGTSSSTLDNLNLEDNPLNRDCQETLASIESIRITMTPRELEEWEDLSI